MDAGKQDRIEQSIKVTGHVSTVIQIGKVIIHSLGERILSRISLEQRVGFILLAMLTVGAFWVLYVRLFPPGPVRMSGDFRIAVASFDDSGDVKARGIGTELANGVYLRLLQAFDEANMGFTVSIWGPDKVGAITGSDEEARANSAERLAQSIAADVVVYGVVNVKGDTWNIIPEFFVSADNFYEAAEVTGQHSLGEPLVVRGNVAGRIDVSSEFEIRTRVLTKIVVGLAYYAVHDFERALSWFLDAEKVSGWADDEGKQVLYLLIGNAYGKIGELDYAEDYYDKALSLDQDYARAYIGLGSVYYIRALSFVKDSGDLSGDAVSLLETAISMYNRAIQSRYRPPLSDIGTKAHLGLGQCYFLLAYFDQRRSFDDAIVQFELVIKDYDNGSNPRVRELAAEAHARLALMYDLSGYPELAIKNYDLAISLLDSDPERQALFRKRVSDIRGGSP